MSTMEVSWAKVNSINDGRDSHHIAVQQFELTWEADLVTDRPGRNCRNHRRVPQNLPLNFFFSFFCFDLYWI